MTASWEFLANPDILAITPYEPGKPVEEVERELGISGAIKLASNENPLPPSPRVQEAVRRAVQEVNRYPDGSGYYLRNALAGKHGVPPDAILLGNGSNDLIELVARTFVARGQEVVYPHPSFIVYPLICQAIGAKKVVVPLKEYRLDLDGMAKAVHAETKVVFIANPNNPTGTIVDREAVARFMDALPQTVIVVFDEAYYEFALGPDFPDSLGYFRSGRKVITLRTFSKISSLAGLRVGYAIADPNAVGLMNRIRQPFNVNSLALVAALAALDDEDHVKKAVALVEEGKHYLYGEFRELNLKYIPTRANFIMVEVGGDARRIYELLLKEGVIVRYVGGAGTDGALRITIGTMPENRRLASALRRVLGQK